MKELAAPKHTVGVSRLSAMMFFQFFVFGSFTPILSMYLQDVLRFTSGQTGFIMAMSVVSSIVAPLLSVYIVDRAVPAKWLYILCHAALAVSFAGLFLARSFEAFLVAYLFNALFNGPTIGMLNAIAFQSLHDREGSGKNYGGVRVWGTIGWMCASYLVSGIWALIPLAFPGRLAAGTAIGAAVNFQSGAFIVAGVGSILCVALAMGLPGRKRQAPAAKIDFLPRDSLGILKRKSAVVLLAVYFISSIIDKMNSFGAAPYLASLGFERAMIPAILTLGQATEILMLFGLGALLSRLSYKPVLMLGGLVQVCRYLLFWTGVPALGIVAITLHGFVFACLYSAILMYVDCRSDARSRQTVHQMIQLFIGGSSTLVGNLLAGSLGRIPGASGGVDYGHFWLFPLCGALATTAIIWLCFREDTA